MSDKELNKEEILSALEKWLDTPAENTGVSYYGDGEGMPANQSELQELDNIIGKIIDYRFTTDYSGWSYIKQYSLLSKLEYEEIYLPIVPKHPAPGSTLEDWSTEKIDNAIRDISIHIKSCSDMIRLWMDLKSITRIQELDKSKKK